MQLRSPPLAYGLVLFVGAAMAPFLLSLDESMLGYGWQRSLSVEFSNLQRTEEIDHSIETRAQMNDAEDKCSR
eukprot:CAMPEP_0183718116 /NCGR_PEP_ID=MMETSP0737-20130205/11461_1 /TAXON_ID=385413 /ORGANISM="Thalassiosira miniscula, Strain CCMP1093" /LENGTH=72 /DNA_ID=CAMNT_0025947611 /DNA_START=47 /DNA_END=262 /DNA_ORIENTATION=+